MTVTEVKALLNETTTTYDDFWEDLIPELEQYAREYTNDENLMFNSASVKLFVSRACKYLASSAATALGTGIKSEKLGDYGIEYVSAATAGSNQAAFPADVLAYLEPYRRPRWA